VIRTAIDLQIFNERGTTVAGVDYARYGHRFGHIEPVLLYHTLDLRGGDDALKRLSSEFQIEKYTSTAERNEIIRHERLDVYYNLLFRRNFERVPGVHNAVHAVFDFESPDGDVFAYVSEWLSEHVTGGQMPYVPHIVTMPTVEDNLRRDLGIPEEGVVIGRYGGFDSFDITFTFPVINQVLSERKDVWFLFANTERFSDHPRIIHLPVIERPEDKSAFINTCDAMLHARALGESFGLAIAEFLALGCPVICWTGGNDKNHLRLQTDRSLRYTTASDLYRILKGFGRTPTPRAPFPVTAQFAPDAVSRKWREVFVDKAGAQSPPPRITRLMQLRRRLLRRRYMVEDVAYNTLSRLQLKSLVQD